MEAKIKHVLERLTEELKVLYGSRLRHVILFGSQATGEARADSDINVLIALTGDVKPGDESARTENIIADLSWEYRIVIVPAFVSYERYLFEDSTLSLLARREGIVFYDSGARKVA